MVSMTPAIPSIEVSGGLNPLRPPNIPNHFCHPWSENVNAAIMRNRDRKYGS